MHRLTKTVWDSLISVERQSVLMCLRRSFITVLSIKRVRFPSPLHLHFRPLIDCIVVTHRPNEAMQLLGQTNCRLWWYSYFAKISVNLEHELSLSYIESISHCLVHGAIYVASRSRFDERASPESSLLAAHGRFTHTWQVVISQFRSKLQNKARVS